MENTCQNLESNDSTDINYDEKVIDSLILNKKLLVEELFENYEGKNLTKEFEWDKPRGREIW